jgi:hypothetical protein
MRTITKSILAAAVLAVGAGTGASAITVDDILGSNYGSVTINYQNYDMGNVYAGMAPGGPVGVWGDGLTAAGAVGPEDSWAIARIQSIQVNNNIVWQNGSGQVDPITGLPVGKGAGEITAIFFGEQDRFVTKTILPGGDVELQITGAGTQFAMVYDSTPDFMIGGKVRDWATRVNDVIFPGVCDPNGVVDNGVIILTGLGIPGITTTDPVADFVSDTVLDAVTGLAKGNSGDMIGDFATITTSQGLLTGLLNDAFVQDTVPPFSQILPPHEFELHFTIGAPPTVAQTENGAQWLAGSNDPLKTSFVPTPTALWGGALLAGLAGVNVLRRRRA